MHSSVLDILPVKVRKTLIKIGYDISVARRKRRLTVEMMAERLCIAKSTYQKIEKGDPKVSMGAYAMAIFVLGFLNELNNIIDPSQDAQGLLMEEENLPKRIRKKKFSEGQ